MSAAPSATLDALVQRSEGKRDGVISLVPPAQQAREQAREWAPACPFGWRLFVRMALVPPRVWVCVSTLVDAGRVVGASGCARTNTWCCAVAVCEGCVLFSGYFCRLGGRKGPMYFPAYGPATWGRLLPFLRRACVTLYVL